MALIKCSECGKEVSSNAQKCIHCGNPLKNPESNENKLKGDGKVVLIVMLIAICVGAGFFFCSYYENEDEAKEERLLEEIEDTRERTNDAVRDYVDTQRTVNDYERNKSIVENAR